MISEGKAIQVKTTVPGYNPWAPATNPSNEGKDKNVMKPCKEGLLHEVITYLPAAIDGRLASVTMSNLLDFFYTKTAHRPSEDMLYALADVAETLDKMASGTCEPNYYLSSLDPGVGKTRVVIEFIKALMRDSKYDNVGVIICVSRLDEIGVLVESTDLSAGNFAVFTSDDWLNQLGSQIPRSSQVLFTTQQMLEKRCEGRTFSEVELFHFEGSVRQVRIWDESIIPGKTLTVNRDDIAFLFSQLRGAHPRLAAGLETLFDTINTILDGDQIAIPNLVEEYGVNANQVLRLLEHASSSQQAMAKSLWLLSGKLATVRQDGQYGKTCLDYCESLPNDLAPVIVLDASGRVRSTYSEWESKRGGLVRLKEAVKSYSNLRIHVWNTGGGKSAFTRRGNKLADGIATTVNSKPNEMWLVVCHKPSIAVNNFESAVRDLLNNQDNVHFITWGNHHATNAYSHIANVILAGTLFYRPSLYESLGRLAAGHSSDRGKYPLDSYEAVVQGEHSHLILQALCRGLVRVSDGSECPPCNAYIIASTRSGIPEAIPTIFPNSHLALWDPVPRALTGKVKEAVAFIRQWYQNHDEDFLPFRAVMAGISMTHASNFASDVRSHPDFIEELANMGIVEFGEGRYSKGFRKQSCLFEDYGFEVESD